MTAAIKNFVLFSGGLDSTVVLYNAIADAATLRNASKDSKVTFEIEAVGIDYGQRHKKELEAARAIADLNGIEYTTLRIPDVLMGAMLTSDQPIPEQTYDDLPKGMSPTYVPFRNGLMLSLLAAHAQKWVMAGATSRRAYVHIGSHAEDAANDAYPDCSVEFMDAMGAAIGVGTYSMVQLLTPLIDMHKAQVIELGHSLNVPFELTWSCYQGQEWHCGKCMTCNARKAGFKAAWVNDPTIYADTAEI
jgi:7-cyano-7-deazaguanine synthase